MLLLIICKEVGEGADQLEAECASLAVVAVATPQPMA